MLEESAPSWLVFVVCEGYSVVCGLRVLWYSFCGFDQCLVGVGLSVLMMFGFLRIVAPIFARKALEASSSCWLLLFFTTRAINMKSFMQPLESDHLRIEDDNALRSTWQSGPPEK